MSSRFPRGFDTSATHYPCANQACLVIGGSGGICHREDIARVWEWVLQHLNNLKVALVLQADERNTETGIRLVSVG